MNNTKVLVTGANGFLGHWLVRRLVSDGLDVSVLVRKGSDLSELDGVDCRHLYGDITNFESLKAAFHGIDTVFHLAGLIAYRTADRQKMNLVNVEGTKNVIAAVKFCEVRKLVHLSSVVAVGASFKPNEILNEESPYNVGHLNLGYFETKLQAELLVKAAFQKKELDCVILNPSTIYGAGDAKKGSRKTQLGVAQGRIKFYTSGGVSIVAVEDVVDGIVRAWKTGRSGERYILSGENLLIRDVFKIIAEDAGQKPPSILIPTALLHGAGCLGDFASRFGFHSSVSRENAWTATLFHWFDCSKAKKELGFNPRSAKIAIGNSVRWMRDAGLLRS